MTHLRKMMLEELQRRNLSKLTAECYVRIVEEFSQYHHRAPDQLGPEQIRQYQAYLFTDRKLDANTVAQHLSALRFFFIKTLKRNWSVEETPYPKRPCPRAIPTTCRNRGSKPRRARWTRSHWQSRQRIDLRSVK